MKEKKNLRQQAISLLARREYTHAELRKKLADSVGKAFSLDEDDGSGADDASDVDAVLADLAARGLLSDERAAASFLRGHGARFGTARLRQSLRDKGLGDEAIATSLSEAELPDELERARAIWQRKFRAAPQDQREWAQQARFLQSRGFSTDVIRRLLKEQKEPTPE